ncbi:hypothetical protein C5167_011624 [Papaver somniferum]|uniref:Uncharacterized protein n=1 Tax=Papaver somniferum TaxID=3469 RepID=A0A4Y7K7F0_PAPSO|nr:hypothetical protein C5167_011624 [Papaver somniferum]
MGFLEWMKVVLLNGDFLRFYLYVVVVVVVVLLLGGFGYMVLAGGGKRSEVIVMELDDADPEQEKARELLGAAIWDQRKRVTNLQAALLTCWIVLLGNDNHLWGTIEVMMCDLGLSSELKLACNSALMKVVGLSMSVLLDKLATGKVTSCIIFCRVSLNESCHDRSTCSVFSIFFCPQFFQELLDTLAGSSLLGRMITSKACLHGRHCDLRIHLLEFPRYVLDLGSRTSDYDRIVSFRYPLYWSPFVIFQVEAYFFTKEDEVVAGSALADMILKETNLY